MGGNVKSEPTVALERGGWDGPVGVLGDDVRGGGIDKTLPAWAMGLYRMAVNGKGVVMIERVVDRGVKGIVVVWPRLVIKKSWTLPMN